MTTWKHVKHSATRTDHVSLRVNEETGIMRETHTVYREGKPTGKKSVHFWHPSEPPQRIHLSFEECREALL